MYLSKAYFRVAGFFLLMELSVGQFAGGRVLRTGTGTNVCGAIIAQCMGRCGDRAKEGIGGTEYVQLTITLRTSETKCTTEETEENEMVSANPPNSNHEVVVFNVPCCQQRPFDQFSQRAGPTEEGTASPKTERNTATTSTTTTKQPFNFNNFILPTTARTSTERSKSPEWTGALILTFTVLCFVLISIILVIMLWKISKKRRGKTFKTATETSPVTSTTSNGAVLIGTNIEKTHQDKRASEVIGNVVRDIEPPPIGSDFFDSDARSSGQSSTEPREDRTTDYVFLETVAPSPPKSAKSSRTRGHSEKSHEVILIGGHHGNNGAHKTPNGYIPNLHQGVGNREIKEVIQPLKATTATTIQPQLPGRNSDKRKEALKRRSDSLPETFNAPSGEYDMLVPNSINENPTSKEQYSFDCEKVHPSVNYTFGTTSLDRLNPHNIYNVLRGDEKTDIGSDYQRLKRVLPNNTGPYDRMGNPETLNKNSSLSSTNVAEDGYVQDFQILNKSQASDVKREELSSEEKEIPFSDYVDAPSNALSNGDTSSLAQEGHKNPSISSEEEKKRKNALQESEDL